MVSCSDLPPGRTGVWFGGLPGGLPARTLPDVSLGLDPEHPVLDRDSYLLS